MSPSTIQGVLALLACVTLACGKSVVLPAIPGDLSTPVQVRLAFNGAHGMRVGWNTFQALDNPTVYYGEHPHNMHRSASSQSSVTYPTSRTWANTVTISGLKPATKYYYKIASTNSTMQSFKTGREAGDMTPYSQVTLVDMGVFGPYGLSTSNVSATGKAITFPLSYGEHTTIQRLAETADDYEFLVHPGDFAYADAWLKEETLGVINATTADGVGIYEGLTEIFFDELSALSASKAYMVTAGNHEGNCVDGGGTESTCVVGQTNFTGFINRYAELMPDAVGFTHTKRAPMGTGYDIAQIKARAAASSVSGAVAPFWYSFDYGMTHYLMIDTETDLGNGIIGPDEVGGTQGSFDGPFGYFNQQIDFIEADLSAVNRNTTPWVIVSGHRPWYLSNGQPCYNCQVAFEPLLLKHNVDVAIFGHTHNMQYLGPVAYNVSDPAGLNNPSSPVYLVNGAAGHFEGLETIPTPVPSYYQWGDNATHYGYNRFDFVDAENLDINFIASKTGEVLKSVSLYKKH